MPWQWISRMFNRELPETQNLASVAKVNHDESVYPIDEARSLLIQKTSNDLEQAFFCWLLNCTNTDLQNGSKELRDKEESILKILDQDILGVDQLPRRPASFPMLIKLLNDENTPSTEISRILLSDPALATQTLKTVNSPFFRISTDSIDSVDRAVFVLGCQGIRNIISATVMKPMMKGKGSKESVFSKKVWEWALLSATASDQYSNIQGHEPGPLYLLGLLPSLAYLVIYRSLLTYQSKHQALGEIEPLLVKSIIQKRSWKLCHEICQQWGLPPSSNKYLLDAERPSPTSAFAPLRDGILMGSHKALQSFAYSPIDDISAFVLTNAPAKIDTKVAQHIEERMNESV